MLKQKDDPVIQITPPIRGTRETPNPRRLILSMKVELPHGDPVDSMSDGDRVQYNFNTVVHTIGNRLHELTENSEVEHWPRDILVVAASALLTANTALNQWLREDYLECLVTSEVAQKQMEEFNKLLGI